MDFSKFGEFGLLGLVMGVLLFLFWKWSKWIMAWIKERDLQHAEERSSWIKVVERMNETWNTHTAQAKQFQDSMTEANRHQREEHKSMIETLARINGYKDLHR